MINLFVCSSILNKIISFLELILTEGKNKYILPILKKNKPTSQSDSTTQKFLFSLKKVDSKNVHNKIL